MSYNIRRKPVSFEEYWLASKAWARQGVTLASGRALVNAGYLTVEDLTTATDLELAMIPRIGPKTLKALYGLAGRTICPAEYRLGRQEKRRAYSQMAAAGPLTANLTPSPRSRP